MPIPSVTSNQIENLSSVAGDSVTEALDALKASLPPGLSYAPTLSPEAWYVLDSVNRLVDLSGNGHTLSTAIAPQNADAPVSGLLSSVNGVLNGAGAAFRTAGALSLVALCKDNAVALISCEKQPTGGPIWWRWGFGGSPQYTYDDGVGPRQSLGPSGFSGTYYPWTVQGFTRAADGVSLKFYSNGALIGTATAPSVAAGSATAELLVGGYQLNTSLFASAAAQMVAAVYLTELSASDMLDISRQLLGQ